MDNPKVTVIIPCWEPNTEWLKEAVDSIEKQTYKNTHLIISEIGLSEATKNIAISNPGVHKNITVRPIIEPPHFLNIYHQINEALKVVDEDTKYVCLCGADDIYYPNKIEEEVKLAEEHDALAVYSDYEYWREDMSKMIGTERLPDEKELTAQRVFRNNVINDLSLVRKDAIDLNVDPLSPRYTWWWFWMRKITEIELAKKADEKVQPIIHCNNVGFKYRQVEKSMHRLIVERDTYFEKDNQVSLRHHMINHAIPLIDKLGEAGVECRLV